MATKSANVLARVEPEVKEQAESIMEAGLLQAKADQSRPATDAIADLRRELQ